MEKEVVELVVTRSGRATVKAEGCPLLPTVLYCAWLTNICPCFKHVVNNRVTCVYRERVEELW